MPSAPTSQQIFEQQPAVETPAPTIISATPTVAAPQPARPQAAPAAWAKVLRKVSDAGRRLLQLQRQYGNRYVQQVVQRTTESEATLQEGDLLAGGTLSASMQAKIQRAQSGGQALDEGVATQMSSAFGQDLSGVRVHTDTTARQLNQELGAEAFTLGRHIFFDEGQYTPNTPNGQQLLAHELTHVVQQDGLNQSEVSGPLTLGAAHDSYENEADHMARQVFKS